MKSEEIREGDIVEIDYIEEYTKEHINEGKALVIWKGFNSQTLVRKLNTKVTIWTCYEHIARVVDHIDLEGYMDKNLSAEPCEDCISRVETVKFLENHSNDFENALFRMAFKTASSLVNNPHNLPSVISQRKIGKWIDDCGGVKCPFCGYSIDDCYYAKNYCPNCGEKMEVEE